MAPIESVEELPILLLWDTEASPVKHILTISTGKVELAILDPQKSAFMPAAGDQAQFLVNPALFTERTSLFAAVPRPGLHSPIFRNLLLTRLQLGL